MFDVTLHDNMFDVILHDNMFDVILHDNMFDVILHDKMFDVILHDKMCLCGTISSFQFFRLSQWILSLACGLCVFSHQFCLFMCIAHH